MHSSPSRISDNGTTKTDKTCSRKIAMKEIQALAFFVVVVLIGDVSEAH